MYSANDYQLYPTMGDATRAVVGGQTVDEDVTFAVPGNVPGGPATPGAPGAPGAPGGGGGTPVPGPGPRG